MKYVPLYLAAVLLLCLAPMPYGYFTLVRFLTMAGFGYLAFQYFKQRGADMDIRNVNVAIPAICKNWIGQNYVEYH